MLIRVPVLLITGPVGSGKTSVLDEISEILNERSIPHAEISVDSLAHCYPRPAGDPHGEEVAVRNLAAVSTNFREAGAERLVLDRVIESRDELVRYQEAIPGAEIIVVRLRASIPVLQDRIRKREIGSGREWHLDRAAELARIFDEIGVEDFLVETDNRTVREIAEEVLGRADWID